MKRMKNAAALILAACFTILPAYSLTAAYRTDHTISAPPQNDAEEPAESPDTPAEPAEPDTPETPDAPGEPSEQPGDQPSEPNEPNEPEQPATPAEPNAPAEPEEPNPPQNVQLYILCTGNGVNLRSGAGGGYKAVATAEKDTSYAVIAKVNGWYCVYYRGKKVYMAAAYAKEFTLEKSDNAAVEKVLEEGYKLLGTPYVYGAVRLHDGAGNFERGFKTSAFDCSSLTQYVFYQGAKKLLGTTTRLQVKQGKSVKRANLSRGDCIYFTNASRYYNTGSERVGHVAIYLGNDYILHTSSDYARIEKLTSARKKYYIEARRFV